MRALMRPGIWLQKITTQEPDPDQIEVAIASFDEVLRCERGGAAAGRPAPRLSVVPHTHLPKVVASAPASAGRCRGTSSEREASP